MTINNSAYSDVLSILRAYLKAVSEPNREQILSVFHPKADLFGIMAGKTVKFSIDEWVERVMNDPKPASDAKMKILEQGSEQWNINSLQVFDNMAFASLGSQFLDVWYTDFMVFLFEEGTWKIVNKTFTYQKFSSGK